MKKFFSETERKIYSLFADTLIPPSKKLPHLPSYYKIIDRLEENLISASEYLRQAFYLALHYIEYRAIFFRLKGKKFSQMGEDLRKNYLKSLYASPRFYRRLIFRLLEVPILAFYYGEEEVGLAFGYKVKKPNKTPSQILYGDSVILHAESGKEFETDVCIIGSGAGGAPAAYSLAKAGFKVLIIEEGSRFDLKDFQGAPSERMAKMSRDMGMSTTLGIPPIPIVTGKGIGGTTVINSGTCFRTPISLLEKWEKDFGLENMSEEKLRPYFEQVEEKIHVMEVPPSLLDPSAKLILKGFEKLGFKGIPLHRNMKSCEGSSLCCFGCPTDAKQSVQLNFIPQAIKHGARILAHCRAQNLIHEEGKVRILEADFIDPLTQEIKSKIKIKAKVFIVAAGTFQTPLILKKAGLGLRSGLLGKNLSIHPAGKVLALFDEPVRGWEGIAQSYTCADLKSEGILFEGAFMPPSIQAIGLLLHGEKHKEVMENFDHVACFGFMISDESRGRVFRRPDGEALVFYSLRKRDLKKFLRATVTLSRLFFESGAKKVFTPIEKFCELNSIEEIEKIEKANLSVKDLEVLAFHPLGTCQMGSDPRNSVLDSYGRVHETKNLFVSDGSIFPTSLGVNPQVSIMAFSLRTADCIKERLLNSSPT